MNQVNSLYPYLGCYREQQKKKSVDWQVHRGHRMLDDRIAPKHKTTTIISSHDFIPVPLIVVSPCQAVIITIFH